MQGHIGVLLDEQDGNTLLIDLPDDLEDIPHDEGGQSQGGLIHHHQLGTAHQGAGHGQHLLLAAGKGPGQLPVALLQAGEQLIAPLDIVIQLIMTQVGADLHILQHRHIGENPPALRHQGNAPLDDLIAGLAQQLLAIVGDGPGLGLNLAGDGAQRGGFAGAIGAHQRNDAAIRHLKGDILYGADPAVIDL